jgi:plastocyanin
VTSPFRGGPAWRRLVLVPAALALVAAASTACGNADVASSGTSSASAPAPSPAGSSMKTMIMIEDFAYETPTSVSPGAKVEVMNRDSEAHTVTSDKGGGFDVTVAADATVTFTAPTTPGSYDFHCTYHSNMHSVLVVK